METKVVKAVCGICPWGCGVEVYIEDGEIVKLEGMTEHPLNRGMLCDRALAVRDFVYHPDRLKYPMKRDGDRWQPISWDEALDTISSKLKEIRDKCGPSALAIFFGQPVLTQGTTTIGFIRRFCDAYGTPSVFSVDSMCWRGRLIGDIATLGCYPLPDPINSSCILLWGCNPWDSKITETRDLIEAKRRGAKLVVIDPRRTFMAKIADVYTPIRPGTDCALMLGMMNVIISEDLHDKEFVQKWTVGFEELREHVKKYSPTEVEKITGIPAETIKEIARMFATIKPACIDYGTNSLEEQGNAVQTARACAILHAITGNIEVPGGLVVTTRRGIKGTKRSIRLLDLVKGKPLGTDKYPLFYGFWGRLFGEGEGQAMLLADAILTGKPYPVKAMIISGANILLTRPNTKKVEESLKKLDFLVVMDLFLTDTAKLADIVLPAATGFERNEIFDFYSVFYPLPYVAMRKKLIQYEECWPDMKFYLELAKRMGYTEYFPWNNMEEVNDYVYEPLGISMKYLSEEKPGGCSFGGLKNEREYKREGFPTPSKKLEIYSKLFEEHGYEPLPSFHEPPESPFSTPELAKEYPLILSSGARKSPFMHSQFRNVARLRRQVPEPYFEINPDTAEKYDLKDGEVAILETKRGSIEVKAKVTEDIMPGLISLTHGWAEANVNILLDDAPADPISGFPSLRAQLCRVRKKL